MGNAPFQGSFSLKTFSSSGQTNAEWPLQKKGRRGSVVGFLESEKILDPRNFLKMEREKGVS
jgi:hypothetical protein